jgi:hypothetical protein
LFIYILGAGRSRACKTLRERMRPRHIGTAGAFAGRNLAATARPVGRRSIDGRPLRFADTTARQQKGAGNGARPFFNLPVTVYDWASSAQSLARALSIYYPYL